MVKEPLDLNACTIMNFGISCLRRDKSKLAKMISNHRILVMDLAFV